MCLCVCAHHPSAVQHMQSSIAKAVCSTPDSSDSSHTAVCFPWTSSLSQPVLLRQSQAATQCTETRCLPAGWFTIAVAGAVFMFSHIWHHGMQTKHTHEAAAKVSLLALSRPPCEC